MKTKRIGTLIAVLLVYGLGSNTFARVVVTGATNGSNKSGWVSFTDRTPVVFDPIGPGQTITAPDASSLERVTLDTLKFDWEPGSPWVFDGAEWEIKVYNSIGKSTLLGAVTNQYTALAKARQTTEFDFGSGVVLTPEQSFYVEITGAAQGSATTNGVAYYVYGNNSGHYAGGTCYHAQLSGTPTNMSPRDMNFEAKFVLTSEWTVVTGAMNGNDNSGWVSFTDRIPVVFDPIGTGQTVTAPGEDGQRVTLESFVFDWVPGSPWLFDGAEWEIKVYDGIGKSTLLGAVTNSYTALAKARQTTEFDFGSGVEVPSGQSFYIEITGAAQGGATTNGVAYYVYGNYFGHYTGGTCYHAQLSGIPTNNSPRDMNFEAEFRVKIIPQGTMIIIR